MFEIMSVSCLCWIYHDNMFCCYYQITNLEAGRINDPDGLQERVSHMSRSLHLGQRSRTVP